MAKILYTARATVTGGRAEGHGWTDDGNLDLQLRVPKEMGGAGGGTNPEQLFAVGYAACFESALMRVAERQQVDASGVVIESAVSMQPNGSGGFQLAVALDVQLPGTDRETAAQIIRTAHEVCPYSNATRNNIEVDLLLNGQAI